MAITAAQMGGGDLRITLSVYTDVSGMKPQTHTGGVLGDLRATSKAGAEPAEPDEQKPWKEGEESKERTLSASVGSIERAPRETSSRAHARRGSRTRSPTRREPAWLRGRRETGATGLEPAASGVTGAKRRMPTNRRNPHSQAGWCICRRLGDRAGDYRNLRTITGDLGTSAHSPDAAGGIALIEECRVPMCARWRSTSGSGSGPSSTCAGRSRSSTALKTRRESRSITGCLTSRSGELLRLASA